MLRDASRAPLGGPSHELHGRYGRDALAEAAGAIPPCPFQVPAHASQQGEVYQDDVLDMEAIRRTHLVL